MAELFEQVVALLDSRSATRASAARFRIGSEQQAGDGSVLCVPILMAELHNWASDSSKSEKLMKRLRTTDTSGLLDPGATIERNGHEPTGTSVTEMLIGDRRQELARQVAAEAGIAHQSAERLFAPAAWAIMASIADRFGNRMDPAALAAILRAEVGELIEAGWGPWLEASGALATFGVQRTSPYDQVPHDRVQYEEYHSDSAQLLGREGAVSYQRPAEYAGPVEGTASASSIALLLGCVAMVLVAVLAAAQFIGGGDGDISAAGAEAGDITTTITTVDAAESNLTDELADADSSELVASSVAGPSVSYEPLGDGASFWLMPGQLVLAGDVADQATLDLILNEHLDLARPGLQVVNGATVVDGSSAPSGRIIVDSSELFALDSDQLIDQQGTLISDLAAILQARSTWTVTIVGHTYSADDEDLNFDLSQRQADAVRAELTAAGVPTLALRTDGVGSSEPLIDDAAPTGRIEILVDRG